MTDWRPHWAKLDSELVTLLEGLPSLPTEDRASVLHYIDHNEYGLANTPNEGDKRGEFVRGIAALVLIKQCVGAPDA